MYDILRLSLVGCGFSAALMYDILRLSLVGCGFSAALIYDILRLSLVGCGFIAALIYYIMLPFADGVTRTTKSCTVMAAYRSLSLGALFIGLLHLLASGSDGRSVSDYTPVQTHNDLPKSSTCPSAWPSFITRHPTLVEKICFCC